MGVKRILLPTAGVLALTGCRADTEPAAPTMPPVINVITPPASDSGMAVLLTVVLVVAALALVAAVVLAVGWADERRRRKHAESVVQALTGRPAVRYQAIGTNPVTGQPWGATARQIEDGRR